MKIDTNKGEYLPKLLAVSLIIISLFMVVVFIAVCFIYFPPRVPSASLSGLGQYGDFFGGFIGGITSIATLGVTVYLATLLNRIERENNQSAIETQKQVVFMQIKFGEITRYQRECDIGLDNISKSPIVPEDIRNGCRVIEMRTHELIVLFPEIGSLIEEDTRMLFTAIDEATTMTFSFRRKAEHFEDDTLPFTITELGQRIGMIAQPYWEIRSKLSVWARK